MRPPTTGSRTGRRRRRAALACLALLTVACTDPRARPAAPVLQLQVAPTFRLTSPGAIIGSLYAFDTDGLRDLNLSVRSASPSFAGDSAMFLPGGIEVTRTIHWGVPAGLATGSQVSLIARVVDFEGFAATDTLHLVVQDSVSSVH